LGRIAPTSDLRNAVYCVAQRNGAEYALVTLIAGKSIQTSVGAAMQKIAR
jgi:hypothetical protein